MSDRKTALLVIDVQKSFEKMPYWDQRLVDDYLPRQARLIQSARIKNWPVVHIYHNSKGPFSPASGLVCAMDFVDQHDDDPVFHKHVHNALTESGLKEWLEDKQIRKLVISGIRSEQCCETTTRIASDLGYECEYVSNATLTFDMQHPVTGETVKAADIISRTELVLADRFAKITSVADYE